MRAQPPVAGRPAVRRRLDREAAVAGVDDAVDGQRGDALDRDEAGISLECARRSAAGSFTNTSPRISEAITFWPATAGTFPFGSSSQTSPIPSASASAWFELGVTSSCRLRRARRRRPRRPRSSSRMPPASGRRAPRRSRAAAVSLWGPMREAVERRAGRQRVRTVERASEAGLRLVGARARTSRCARRCWSGGPAVISVSGWLRCVERPRSSTLRAAGAHVERDAGDAPVGSEPRAA